MSDIYDNDRTNAASADMDDAETHDADAEFLLSLIAQAGIPDALHPKVIGIAVQFAERKMSRNAALDELAEISQKLGGYN